MQPNVFDFYHLSKRLYHESKQKGEANGTMLAFAGGCLVYLGATMVLRGLKMRQGGPEMWPSAGPWMGG